LAFNHGKIRALNAITNRSGAHSQFEVSWLEFGQCGRCSFERLPTDRDDGIPYTAARTIRIGSFQVTCWQILAVSKSVLATGSPNQYPALACFGEDFGLKRDCLIDFEQACFQASFLIVIGASMCNQEPVTVFD